MTIDVRNPQRLETPLLVGGQAVIEGVMMRSPHWATTAVRAPHGEILTVPHRLDSLLVRFRWLRAPIVRGVIVLYEALRLGVQALLMSANVAQGNEVPLTAQQVAVSVISGLGLAIGLFFVLPTVAVRLLEQSTSSSLEINLVEGALRVAIVFGYLILLSRVPDLRRVFEYHGAEHKAVNAYEAGAPLEVNAVRAHSRFHPRCGTSFILVVMLVSIVVFTLLGHPTLVIRILSRIGLIPLLAGVSYEVLRAGARSQWLHPAIVPGLWLQRLTTREPDDAQLEVAIRALAEVVEREHDMVLSG